VNRRKTILALVSLGVVPFALRAQQADGVPRIGYLTVDNPEPNFGYFKEGLQKLGYQDGRNIRIEFRNAEGKEDRLAEFAAELVRLKVDVLVVRLTQAILAAKQATREIPIVMVGAADPVGTGIIASLARPGGNITGTSSTVTETSRKLLEFIREVLPRAKRIAVLVNANDAFSKLFLAQIQSAGQKAGVEILPALIRTTGDMEKAYPDFVKRRAEFIIVQPSLPLKRAADRAQHQLRQQRWRPDGLFLRRRGRAARCRGLRGQDPQRREARRPARAAADKVRTGDQHQDRQSTRHQDSAVAAAARRPGDRMTGPRRTQRISKTS